MFYTKHVLLLIEDTILEDTILEDTILVPGRPPQQLRGVELIFGV